jgi:hypothetical protein
VCSAHTDRKTNILKCLQAANSGVKKYIDLVRSRSFKPTMVHADPLSSFKAIVKSFPGYEVDISRAGENLDKVGIWIRQLKKLM